MTRILHVIQASHLTPKIVPFPPIPSSSQICQRPAKLCCQLNQNYHWLHKWEIHILLVHVPNMRPKQRNEKIKTAYYSWIPDVNNKKFSAASIFFYPTLLLCSRNFGRLETLQIVLIQVGEIWGIQQKLILCRHSTRAGGGGGGQPSCQ